MAKLPNGMIAFFKDQNFPSPKMLDIEVTNTFPMIALSAKTHLISSNKPPEIIEEFNHLSIPPDFRLHLSGKKEHLFFDANPVWDFLEKNSNQPFHYFTVLGLPAKHTTPVGTPGQTRRWYGTAMIFPFKDKLFNDKTRLFADFFLHHLPLDIKTVHSAPFVGDGMRLASDHNGPTLGPYDFSNLQRRKPSDKKISFTIRFGFANIENNNEEMYIYTPLRIFQRRPRLASLEV